MLILLSLRRKYLLRAALILKPDEILTIAYILTLILTTAYGVSALDSRYHENQKLERQKYLTGTPPDKIEGAILILASSNDLDLLTESWKAWIHNARLKMYRTEIFIIGPHNLSWYPIGPIFKRTNCQDGENGRLCKFNEGLKGVVESFPIFRWCLVINAAQSVNWKNLDSLVSSFSQGYARSPLLKGAVTMTNQIFHLNGNSGWLMSRRTVFDWIANMEVFKQTIQENGSFDVATGSFLAKLHIRIKQAADPRFVPNHRSADDFFDLNDYFGDPCPHEYRYFDLLPYETVRVPQYITWNIQAKISERRVLMNRLPYLSNYYGYLTNRTYTELCVFERDEKVNLKKGR